MYFYVSYMSGSAFIISYQKLTLGGPGWGVSFVTSFSTSSCHRPTSTPQHWCACVDQNPSLKSSSGLFLFSSYLLLLLLLLLLFIF